MDLVEEGGRPQEAALLLSALQKLGLSTSTTSVGRRLVSGGRFRRGGRRRFAHGQLLWPLPRS
eukprot:11155716-Lingulodinium_polyedra.AAC.1